MPFFFEKNKHKPLIALAKWGNRAKAYIKR